MKNNKRFIRVKSKTREFLIAKDHVVAMEWDKDEEETTIILSDGSHIHTKEKLNTLWRKVNEDI